MKELLKIYQIFYKDEQREKIIYEPFFNDKCTIFFENSVIKDLIDFRMHKKYEYFGVVSHNLLEKIPGITYKNLSNKSFDPEKFEKTIHYLQPDAISFQTIAPHHPILVADKYHPEFSRLFKKIIEKIGYEFNDTNEIYKTVFYHNHFVAKSEIYEDYVQLLLKPAMEVMSGMPELMKDSKYYKKLPENLKIEFGVDHYPMHTFLCERLFSYYAHVNKLNCIQY